jgi:uncharacterized protein
MKILLSILITVVGLYLVILLVVYLLQERLLFFPQPLTYQVRANNNVEEVSILTAGGNVLHGWFSRASSPGKQKLIIYFGGNAEEVSHMMAVAPAYHDWAWLLINYPGYGNSKGRPGKKSFYDAALAIYDYAIARDDVDVEKIVVMGRSIGTGSAVFLARQRDVRAVILISPFESLRSVAQSSMPFLPVGLLLRHNFTPKKHAPGIQAPLLAFYGTQDNIIAPRHTMKLMEYWRGSHTLIPLQGYGHNDLFASEQLWEEMEAFLSGL